GGGAGAHGGAQGAQSRAPRVGGGQESGFPRTYGGPYALGGDPGGNRDRADGELSEGGTDGGPRTERTDRRADRRCDERRPAGERAADFAVKVGHASACQSELRSDAQGVALCHGSLKRIRFRIHLSR